MPSHRQKHEDSKQEGEGPEGSRSQPTSAAHHPHHDGYSAAGPAGQAGTPQDKAEGSGEGQAHSEGRKQKTFQSSHSDAGDEKVDAEKERDPEFVPHSQVRK